MDPEEDLDQDQPDAPSEPEDSSEQQSTKASSNPRSDNYSGEGGQDQSRRERKKELKSEVKNRKKESGKEQKLDKKDKDDPLNQKHEKENRTGHIPVVGGYAKAHEQSETGEKAKAGKTLIKQRIKRKIREFVVKAAVNNPWVRGGILFVIFVIFLIVVVMGDPAGGDPLTKLTITKSGPTTAGINDELPYQITVTYPNQAVDIVVTDRIPDGTDYIDSSPSANFDSATRTATWNLKDYQTPPGAILSNTNTTLSIRLRASANDLVIVNQAEGTVTPYTPPPTTGGGGPPAEGYIPPAPESNNCSGKYDFSKYPENNPLGNYGDPQCNFSKDNLYKLLQSKETNPEFVNIWFNVIVPAESGYSPQAWAPPVGQQKELDAGGAWGLYQMGSSTPPGSPPPSPGQNGEFDRGDVNWEIQTRNAHTYWKESNCNFWGYWGSYRKSGLPDVDYC